MARRDEDHQQRAYMQDLESRRYMQRQEHEQHSMDMAALTLVPRRNEEGSLLHTMIPDDITERIAHDVRYMPWEYPVAMFTDLQAFYNKEDGRGEERLFCAPGAPSGYECTLSFPRLFIIRQMVIPVSRNTNNDGNALPMRMPLHGHLIYRARNFQVSVMLFLEPVFMVHIISHTLHEPGANSSHDTFSEAHLPVHIQYANRLQVSIWKK